MITYSDLFIEIINEDSITYKEAANRISVTYPTFYNWKNKRRYMSKHTFCYFLREFKNESFPEFLERKGLTADQVIERPSHADAERS